MTLRQLVLGQAQNKKAGEEFSTGSRFPSN